MELALRWSDLLSTNLTAYVTRIMTASAVDGLGLSEAVVLRKGMQ
jgi:hypothetical protein